MSPAELQSLPNASLAKRLLSTLYDVFPLFGVAFLYTALAMVIAAQFGVEQTHLTTEQVGDNLVMRADDQFQPALHGAIYQLGMGISLLAFYTFFWRRSGQTLGMQAWRIRLIRADGRPLDVKTCLGRAVLGVLALFLLGIGYLWIPFNKRRLALHDLATGTRVVQLPKPQKSRAGEAPSVAPQREQPADQSS